MAQNLNLQSMSGLLAFARASLVGIGGGANSSIQHLLETSPGFSFLQSFFAEWLKVDLTTLVTALAIFQMVPSAVRDLQSIALRLYWWIIRFFTASVSIGGHDRLNREVLNWLGAQVLASRGTRILTARSEVVQTDAWHYRRMGLTERNDHFHEKRVPVQYLPTFGTTWFFFERNFFVVRRILTRSSMTAINGVGMPDEFTAAPDGDEPLVIMCLGLSVNPIKRFLDQCRDFADQQRASYVTVRASKSDYGVEVWDTTILRPIRPMETVHFDENTKKGLVADIANYLDPATRRFYTARGIPYRRGYLLHGPPGTGKTSLALALAGYFSLELYLLHLPTVRGDKELEKMFTSLPPRCIVLLEDIDAVGVKRVPAGGADPDDRNGGADDEDEDDILRYQSRCTLSGLLNVLDGVASQEGRIVLMTSNMADKLDKALVRPGRIDRMIFLGSISPHSAESMFRRMYTPDSEHDSGFTDAYLGLKPGELESLAAKFAETMPEDKFTPAQVQGYLLRHRSTPRGAVEEAAGWVQEETAQMAEAKRLAKEAAERRAKRRREKSLRLLAQMTAETELEKAIGEKADSPVAEKAKQSTSGPDAAHEEKGENEDTGEKKEKEESGGEKGEKGEMEATREKEEEPETDGANGTNSEGEPAEPAQHATTPPRSLENAENGSAAANTEKPVKETSSAAVVSDGQQQVVEDVQTTGKEN